MSFFVDNINDTETLAATMHFEYTIEGGDFTHAGYASSQVKKVLKQLNVDPKLVKRVVVCLYEAEVNIVAHAYSGIIYTDIDTERIVMRLVDKGPGIPEGSLQHGGIGHHRIVSHRHHDQGGKNQGQQDGKGGDAQIHQHAVHFNLNFLIHGPPPFCRPSGD